MVDVSRAREFSYEVEVPDATGLRKQAVVRRRGPPVVEWTIASDEPEFAGGGNTAPSPIVLMAAAMGLCMASQLTMYSKMMRLSVSAARVNLGVTWRSTGSVVAGTVAAECVAADLKVEIESHEAPAALTKLVRNAERGCYVMQTVALANSVRVHAVINGSIVSLAGRQ